MRKKTEQREDESQETGSKEGGNDRRKETVGWVERVDKTDALFQFVNNIPASQETDDNVIIASLLLSAVWSLVWMT